MQSKNVKNVLSAIFMTSFVSFLFVAKSFEQNGGAGILKNSFSSSEQKYHISLPVFSVDNKYGLFLSSNHAGIVSDFNYLYNNYDNAVQQIGEDFLGKTFLLKSLTASEKENIKIANEELKKDKTNILANVYLAHISFLHGDYKKVDTYFKNLNEKAENVVIKLLRAWNLVAQKKYDDAMDLLETEFDNRAFRKLVLMHLGAIAELAEDDEYADELYDLVLTTDKPNIYDLENISAFYARTGAKFDKTNNNQKQSKNIETKENSSSTTQSTPKYIKVIKDYYAKYPESLSNYSLLKLVENSSYRPESISNANQGFAKALFDTASILSMIFSYAMDLQLFYYNMVANLYPKFYMSNIVRSEIYKNVGDTDLFNNIVSEIPESHYLYLTSMSSNIAHLLKNPSTKTKALSEYKKLLDKYPDFSLLYFRLGKYYETEKDYKKAVDYYTKALSLTDNSMLLGNILFSRAQCYDMLNDKEKTIADLEASFTKNPNNSLLLNYYGYYLINNNIDIEKGLNFISKVISVNPTNPYFLDSYGWGLFKSGNIEKAQSILEMAKSLQPKNPIFSDHLADVYWSAGRKREAVFEWKKALQNQSNLSGETSSELLDVNKIEYKINFGL